MNIENKKQFAIILLAVGLGLVASFLTSQFVQTNIQNQTSTLAKEYSKNTGSLVQEVERLKTEMNNVMSRQEELAQQQNALPKMLSSDDKEKGVQMKAFSINTPPGKRALTLLFDSLAAVGGLVHVGDYVDVIGHLDMPTGEKILEDKRGSQTEKKETVTTMLFQNLEILAVDMQTEAVEKTPRALNQTQNPKVNVTLAVSPEEAGLISFAQENGRLQLVLRSPAEKQNWQLRTATWNSLSDFLMENQGTDLLVPKPEPKIIDAIGVRSQADEVGDYIEIFRGGKQGGKQP